MNLKFTFLLFVNFIPVMKLYSQYQVTGKPENLGNKVNSVYEELSPIISPDGNSLYFVREGDPRNTRYTEIEDSQDIWFSQMQEDGKWSKAKHMGFPLNQRKYNNILSVSWDGSTIMIRGAYKNGEYVGKGFSFSQKEGQSWTLPQMLNISDFEEMSKGSTYGGYLSADGKVIVMYLSEAEGTPTDIYASFLQKDDTWSRPMNLGQIINTDVKDASPFLSADGLTLYFSSKRAGGYGDQDIWYAQRLDDTWRQWSNPVNMGNIVNSDDYDSYFSIPASGGYAYMVSYKNSFGKADIVRVPLK